MAGEVIIKKPLLHSLVTTKKEMHGWYRGKRECTAERLLINPYNGCSVNCFYCYARALPGYFKIFSQKNIIFVCKDFDKVIAKQLDSLNIVSCGYLSPVTDPFQELEKVYHLSEKIIEEFVKRNIPIEFITKCKIPDRVIDLIKTQKHSFGQISILTTNENLRKILAPGGASTEELFCNLKKLSEKNIFSVCRIDPILPFITDAKDELFRLIERAIDSGARHIIASILDIPLRMKNFVLHKIKKYFGSEIYANYISLYSEKIGYLNAEIGYRRRIFEFLKEFCSKKRITFSLCMEYEIKDNKIKGLNREFMTSNNCEGIDIPLYVRKGRSFDVLYECSGNCLNCSKPLCGIKDLAMANPSASRKDFKLKDYRRWAREISNKIEL
ncbi:MAG: radical SAM protein [Candidatus Omnitrophota bacterium]